MLSSLDLAAASSAGASYPVQYWMLSGPYRNDGINSGTLVPEAVPAVHGFQCVSSSEPGGGKTRCLSIRDTRLPDVLDLQGLKEFQKWQFRNSAFMMPKGFLIFRPGNPTQPPTPMVTDLRTSSNTPPAATR